MCSIHIFLLHCKFNVTDLRKQRTKFYHKCLGQKDIFMWQCVNPTHFKYFYLLSIKTEICSLGYSQDIHESHSLLVHCIFCYLQVANVRWKHDTFHPFPGHSCVQLNMAELLRCSLERQHLHRILSPCQSTHAPVFCQVYNPG